MQRLIRNLILKRKEDVAARVMKKLHVPKEKYPEVQKRLIENSARSMPKWGKEKFSWEKLEEVYNHLPSAIACCIKEMSFKKKVYKFEEYEDGV